MRFLFEEIDSANQNTLHSFTESIVLITIYGRCLIHRRLAQTSTLAGKQFQPHNTSQFWKWHTWLADATERQMRPMAEMSIDMSDSFVPFNQLLGLITMIHLSDTASTYVYYSEEQSLVAKDYELRAYRMVTDAIYLLSGLPRLSCFKVSQSLRPSRLIGKSYPYRVSWQQDPNYCSRHIPSCLVYSCARCLS